jgi:hypothetical protein
VAADTDGSSLPTIAGEARGASAQRAGYAALRNVAICARVTVRPGR